jgi:hypothetical protein
MMITLQDVTMLLGLPIRSDPVIGPVVSEGWRAHVEEFLETALPEDEPGRSRHVSGVRLLWLRATFGSCPNEADEAMVTFHFRAWVLHMFRSVLFSDDNGDSASWMYIHYLRD